jgi:regulator of sigma E protease
MNLQFILEFAGALIALILIHEIGHFTAARLLKVEVEEFGIGIPPRALTLFTWQGTKFSLNWLPLGGFVRLKGENDPSVPGGLAASKPWVRLGVYAAGPIMNLIAGVTIYALAFGLFGKPEALPNQVQIFITPELEAMPAYQTGLRSCDIITSINDQPIASVDEFRSIVRSLADQPAAVGYQRAGQASQLTLTPLPDPDTGAGYIGVYPGSALVFNKVSLDASWVSGFQSAGVYARELLTLPYRLLRREIPAEQGRAVGIKGMIDMYTFVRQENYCAPGLFNVLGFFAAISLSLGILNLLPIPALDGGRMLLVLPEIVLRRRVPPEFENWAVGISFILLIALLLYINLQDFINPINLP